MKFFQPKDKSRLTPGGCHNGSVRYHPVMLALTGFIFLMVWVGAAPLACIQHEAGERHGAEASDNAVRSGNTSPEFSDSISDSPLTVGKIDLVVHDIYRDDEVSSSSGFLRFVRNSMNAMHIETHHYVLRRELLFRTGDPLNLELLSETERNLRDLGFLSRICVVPVDTLGDGSVDIEVQVQETWSLKTEFAYSRASGGSRRWNVFLSDDNFFGHGFQLGVGLGETEDFHYTSLHFRKRHFLGTRWELAFGKADRGDDGYSDWVSLRRPFYAQDDTWSLEINAWRDLAERRFYLSNAGPAGEFPAGKSRLYVLIPVNNEGSELAFFKRISPRGIGRIWRFGVGLNLQYLDFDFDEPDLELSDGRQADFDFLMDGATPLARERGSKVYPHLVLSSSGRTWSKTSFLLEYGSTEDVPTDPFFELRAGVVVPGAGSASIAGERFQADVRFRDWGRAGAGFRLLEGAGYAALGGPAERTSAESLLTAWLGRFGSDRAPRLTRLFAEVGWGDRLNGTEPFVLGLNRGLRTLEFDGMVGDRLVRWNAEQGQAFPFEVLGFYRMGVAVFYGGGSAWWHGEDRGSEDIRHELGFGLRLGPTRAGRADVARLDLTWGVDSGDGPVVTAVTRGLF